MKKRPRLFSLAAAAALVCLPLFSVRTKAAAVSALQICTATLIPTLFPFYVAANVLIGSGLPPAGKKVDALFRRLFGLPGAAAPALALGLLGGYPVGASVTASLYRQGTLSEEEAVSLSCFANNAGPAFVIGAAGLAVFQSFRVGLFLYLIHVLSALLTGFFLREPCCRQASAAPVFSPTPGVRLLPEAVFAAVKSMAMICAYVILCFVLLAVINALPLFGQLFFTLNEHFPGAEALLSGILELSSGVLLLAGAPQASALIVVSFLLGWGGLCVFFQAASVLSAVGLPARPLLRAKAIQAFIAAALTCLLCGFCGRKPKFFLGFAVFSLVLACILQIRGRKMKRSLL